MKRCLLACLLFAGTLTLAQNSYEVTNSAQVKNEGCQLTKLVILLPVPESNPYQVVTRFSEGDADKLVSPNTQSTYLRKIWESNLPAAGTAQTLSEEMDITLFPMRIDFKQIDQLYPYDQRSEEYIRYTASDGVYINTANPTIVRISNELWQEADGNILSYARLAYEYVASHFRYLNPLTGLHPLSKLLSDGGGDCGNLATIYINLLRAKGIPARHITTVRPDGTYHVWADFYLQNWGWIPVDVNMKLDDPNGDYFGWCKGDGIVMNMDINHQVEYEIGKTATALLLQSYYYWFWYSSSNMENPISSTHIVNSKNVTPIRTFKRGEVSHRHISANWTANTYATGYRLAIRESGQDEVLQSVDLDPTALTYTFKDLTPETPYVMTFEALRKVDNLITTMNKIEMVVITMESPAANEGIETSPVVKTHTAGIELNLADVSKLVVLTADGRAVHQGSYSAGSHQVPLKPGIYFVVLTDTKGTATRCKVCVQ